MFRVVGDAAVVERIKFTYDRYEKEAYNIFKFYAAEIMSYFMEVQGNVGAETKGEFWTNHTFQAVAGFFAKAFQVPGTVGVTIANETWYAEILETGHDGRFASFPTIMERFTPMIMRDLRVLYGDV